MGCLGDWINRLSPFGASDAIAPAIIANSFDASQAKLIDLGYAGARLCALSQIGLPVQPGFIIGSDICRSVQKNGTFPEDFSARIDEEVEHLRNIHGANAIFSQLPFCLTVRVSSKSKVAGVSSPIFHVGMNDQIAINMSQTMAKADENGSASHAHLPSADQRAAAQYLRFLYQFSENALGVTPDILEDLIDHQIHELGLASADKLGLEDLIVIGAAYRRLLKDEHDIVFPTDLDHQLDLAVTSAIKSWMSRRAIMQRQIQEIDEQEGLAVMVQLAVFGDFDGMSGQGFLDTRDPETGQKTIGGWFSFGAVGELNASTSQFDINLSDRAKTNPKWKDQYSDFERQLMDIAAKTELFFGTSQRAGLVLLSGHCFISDIVPLQLTAEAELKISVDLAKESVISKQDALVRVDPVSLEQLLHPSIEADIDRTVIASGISASPGAACGAIVFAAEDAITAHREGRKTILVRTETSPEDIRGMHCAEGILTIRGGTTSHAAVIARGMGKPCVCGANSLRINRADQSLMASGHILKAGDLITLDGTKGEVLLGELAMRKATLSEEFQELMRWSDEARRMEIRTNSEAPEDVQVARQFGAQGVGLCRTEHMFFESDRIFAMREMILAETEDGRRAALDRLLPMQESDFLELFEAANGQPITIRLLDPPLHEFLPQSDQEITHTAQSIGVDDAIIRRRIAELAEFNPMLGHRGCRLAISYPEITEMQARAIMRAAIDAGQKTGSPVVPEIMVPLVALKKELDFVKERIDQVAQQVMDEKKCDVHYLVGTMIELPRAVIRAADIAKASEFFSFGTNDLTQMTFGISRDDASPFLKTYRQKAVMDEDPFASLDFEAIGEMISMAIERGRQTRPDLKLGVCGEHGGDPVSVKFFDKMGLDYVSCSPFRVPIAKLAAAQAHILHQREGSSV